MLIVNSKRMILPHCVCVCVCVYVCLFPACSDYLFKLLLIGDSGVGKSCLLLRFAVSYKLRILVCYDNCCLSL